VSGRNQHFIPQSLLRGFGVKRGKKTYVVAYTYDRGTFAPPTDGIGAEGNFYSELDVKAATETLDDKITDYEQRLPSIFKQLREVSAEADPALAAELVTHLTVRNAHFRKATAVGGAGMFEVIGRALGNEDTARVLLGVAGDEPSEMFAAQLPEMWAKYGPLLALGGITQEQFNALAFQAVKANFSSFHAEIAEPLQQTFSNIVEKVPEIAANAQRRSLTESLTPQKRVDRLAEYSWRTIETAEPVVLPDCVAVGVDMDGILPLMLADLDQTDTVLMPLTTNRLLIGSLIGASEVQANINEVFASCSWDFFVARERTPELESYRMLLRTASETFMSGSVEGVIEESLAKHRPR
jgi:hypothetical protein